MSALKVEGERTNQMAGGDVTTGAKYFGSMGTSSQNATDYYFQKNLKTLGILAAVTVLGLAVIRRPRSKQ